jgi:hypothetical protein
LAGKIRIGDTLEFAAKADTTYRLNRAEDAARDSFTPIDGQPATSVKRLGPVSIGIAHP